jgi:Co/Zn/Cd efflux system component
MEALLSFVIAVIIICVIAGIVLWAVQRFFPEIYPPARLIVGAFALIAILLQLMRLMDGGFPEF